MKSPVMYQHLQVNLIAVDTSFFLSHNEGYIVSSGTSDKNNVVIVTENHALSVTCGRSK
jgi:hypothetical protein